jgi:polysaccharide export outer membrane protein
LRPAPLSFRALLAGVLTAQLFAAGASHAGTAATAADATPPSAPAAPAAANPDYRVGTDDTLEVVVFQVPEMSRVVQVDSNGGFVLPLIGRVPAAGRTVDQIEADLRTKLDGGYLRNPVVTVLLKQSASQRVTVDGAVTQPGVYSLSGPTSLLQALALAKGPDPRLANVRRVAIFRTVEGNRRGTVYDLTRIRSGAAPDPLVQSDDIIVVDSSGARTFFSLFGSTLTFLTLLHVP